MPLIRLMADAETGHKLSIKLLGAPAWMRPRDRGVDGEELQAEVSVVAVPHRNLAHNAAIRYEVEESSRYGCWAG